LVGIIILRDGIGLNKIKINELLKEVDEISKMIAKSLLTLKNIKK
jgi:hypothetical protein